MTGVSPAHRARAAEGQVAYMSRTDVHRPIRVQELDPTVRHWFADFHHHERGTCTLDSYLAGGGLGNPLGCYRQPWTQSPNLCGCRLCTGQAGRKLRRRQERGQWRTARQRVLADRGFDMPPIRGTAW